MQKILYGAYNRMKTAIGLTGLPLAVSRLNGHHKVVILTYHNPSPSFFAGHASWLVRYYNVIPFDLFSRAIEEHDGAILPPRPLVVTLDDGYRENVDLIPVLVKYKLPILIYLTAGMIGTSRKFWWLVVRETGGDTAPLKRLPAHEFFKALRARFAYAPEKEYPRRCALNWEELYRLQKTGLVSFGSHSVNHPVLTNCPEDMAWKEIIESKHLLECKLNVPVTHFCYPNGNCSAREKKMLRDAGYATGKTAQVGWIKVSTATDPYALPVLREPDNDNIYQLSYALAGFDVVRKRLSRSRAKGMQGAVEGFSREY